MFVCSSVCLFVRLSSVKFVKSIATWQHLAASGGLSYRLRCTRYARLSRQHSSFPVSVTYLVVNCVKLNIEHYATSNVMNWVGSGWVMFSSVVGQVGLQYLQLTAAKDVRGQRSR